MFKWHYFDQVYSRFTRDGKMAFFTSQTRPLRRETSQRRQPEVFLAVISLPLAVTDVCRRRILSRLVFLALEEWPTLRQQQEMTTLLLSFQHEIIKEENWWRHNNSEDIKSSWKQEICKIKGLVSISRKNKMKNVHLLKISLLVQIIVRKIGEAALCADDGFRINLSEIGLDR